MIRDLRAKIRKKERQKRAARYIEEGGLCPYCGSACVEDNATAEIIKPAVREVRAWCNECGATWGEVYELIEIETEMTEEVV
jgi:hypothetical protein